MADRFDQLLLVQFPAAPPRLYAEIDTAVGNQPKKSNAKAAPATPPAKQHAQRLNTAGVPVNDSLAVVEAASDLGWRRACEVRLAKLARRGFGDRVQGFRIVRQSSSGMQLGERFANEGHSAILALHLDDDEAFR